MTTERDRQIERDVAQEFAGAFTTDERRNGERFIRLVDGIDAPEWIVAIVRKAHDDELPNDWRYGTIVNIAEEVAEASRTGEAFDNMDPWDTLEATGAYRTTRALAMWIANVPSRAAYVDEAIQEEFGCGTFDAAAAWGMRLAVNRMAEAIVRGLMAEAARRAAAPDDN